MCQQRQNEVVCSNCSDTYKLLLERKKCAICANPSLRWVCKRCQVANWAFDATYSLSSDISRLVPLLKKYHLHGNLKQLKGICHLWDTYMQKHFLPVDYLIPLPEPLSQTQIRGFQSHLVLAKHLSKITRIPLLQDFLGSYPTQATPVQPRQSPFKVIHSSQLKSLLENKRIGVVGSYMQSEYIYHHFASEIKQLGALWLSNWIMIRIPNQKTKTCSILS